MKVKEERVRIVTLRIPVELLEVLDRYAYEHELSRSEIIRSALLEFLRKNGYNVERKRRIT